MRVYMDDVKLFVKPKIPSMKSQNIRGRIALFESINHN